VCLTINDDNIQYTHVLPSSQGATTTTIATACFDPSFVTTEKWGSYLSEVTYCQIIDRSQLAVLPYRTAATVEVIIVIESDVYDGVGHWNKWMDGWMEMNEWMDDDDDDDYVEIVVIMDRLVSCTYTAGMM
jgi:hypothetical protein